MAEKGSGAFLGGVILGGAIGAIAGMWIDPRTTRRVRRTVRKTVEQLPELAHQVSDTTIELSDRLHQRLSLLAQELREDWQETSGRLREAAAAGLEASQREYHTVMDRHDDRDRDLDRP